MLTSSIPSTKGIWSLDQPAALLIWYPPKTYDDGSTIIINERIKRMSLIKSPRAEASSAPPLTLRLALFCSVSPLNDYYVSMIQQTTIADTNLATLHARAVAGESFCSYNSRQVKVRVVGLGELRPLTARSEGMVK